jgi:uncharacterized Zn-binding protein involved in type VI secretion
VFGRPAARVGDPTAHGNPLAPGPGSPDVIIGGRPAWRGLSPAMVARLLDLAKDVAEDATKALEAPSEALRAKFLKDMTKGDGNGVVINGSSTVLINNLPACRMGDTIQEATSVNAIAGGDATVLIG